MNPYAICILLSAFLLFQIQPLISKTFLPWFGGTPAVWSTAMLFFQVLLTAGYAWSNWLAGQKSAKKQVVIHLVLMLLSVALLVWLWINWPSPITPAQSWRPADLTHPLLSIFLLLAVSVGLPFLVLSTNSPLMQAWFSRKHAGKSPYWLYALSNIGSMVGLIAYPVLVEPNLTTPQQGRLWTIGYFVFILLAAINAFLTLKAPKPGQAAALDEQPAVAAPAPSKWTQGKWLLLSACPSLLLLAVTSQITQEVAVIPFLWVLPMTLYLLSFVVTFSNRSWYRRGVFTILLLLGTAGSLLMLVLPQTHFIIQIVVYNLFLFSACVMCNGELYALRPPASRLTRFYLWSSVGGALGGLFVSLLAPLLFKGYWELYIGLALVWLLLWICHPPESAKDQLGSLAGAMTVVISMLMVFLIFQMDSGSEYARRNFFGVVSVRQGQIEPSGEPITILAHGITLHGFQFQDPELRDIPTSYFAKEGGGGLAILNNPHYGSGMRVGVLGLGIGTLAAYGQPGDEYRFYEINPVVIDLANGQGGYFSFVPDSQAEVTIVEGDARISLENELQTGQANNFDLLLLDVFNSDSIPTHLLSQQAFEVYLQHLAPDGMIATNISNRRLDLRPVFWQLAQHFDMHMGIVQVMPQQGSNAASGGSVWVLLTRNPALLQAPGLVEHLGSLEGFRRDTRLWTDDYSNLFQLLR